MLSRALQRTSRALPFAAITGTVLLVAHRRFDIKSRLSYPNMMSLVGPQLLLAPSRLAYCEEGKRVYIGLSVRSMMDQPGMMVLLVNTESPAWQADMKVGDILLEIDGNPINMINDLHSAVAGAHGRTLVFKVSRKGAEMLLHVTFAP